MPLGTHKTAPCELAQQQQHTEGYKNVEVLEYTPGIKTQGAPLPPWQPPHSRPICHAHACSSGFSEHHPDHHDQCIPPLAKSTRQLTPLNPVRQQWPLPHYINMLRPSHHTSSPPATPPPRSTSTLLCNSQHPAATFDPPSTPINPVTTFPPCTSVSPHPVLPRFALLLQTLPGQHSHSMYMYHTALQPSPPPDPSTPPPPPALSICYRKYS